METDVCVSFDVVIMIDSLFYILLNLIEVNVTLMHCGI